MSLTDKETVELRIKCIEAIMPTATKMGIESGTVFEVAEKAWSFATARILGKTAEGNPASRAAQKAK